MNSREKKIILAVSVACVVIGVGAGAKLAQIQRDEADNDIRITLEKAKPAVPASPEKVSADFYAATSATKEKPAAPKDPITAESYLVGDVDTGKILMQKNPDEVLPFASMSKLITALVATTILKPDSTFTITAKNLEVPPDISNLKEGETFSMNELLYPLLMTSSNVAADAFSYSVSSSTRSDFLQAMNEYSWEVGMSKAHYADPSGVDPANSGTARGFFSLAQYLYAKRQDLLSITRTVKKDLATTTEHGFHALVNIHPFASDPRFLGGKTGHTPAAMDTMLTILEIGNRPVAFIVLRSDDRTADTKLLIEKLQKI